MASNRVGPLFLALITLWIGTCSVHAEELQLFARPGVPVKNYNKLVANIREGDTLVFSNGKKFNVVSILSAPGSGNTTLVVEIPGNKALRIPLADGFLDPITPYHEFITEYLTGAKALESVNAPIVKVFFEMSLAEEYVVVEKLDIKFTLAKLLDRLRRHELSTMAQYLAALDNEDKAAVKKLMELAERLARLTDIGDFSPDQIGWVKGEWIIFDFTSKMEHFEEIDDKTVFDFFFLPQPLKDEVQTRIVKVRERIVREEIQSYLKQRNRTPKTAFDTRAITDRLYRNFRHRPSASVLADALIRSELQSALSSNDRELVKSALVFLNLTKSDFPDDLMASAVAATLPWLEEGLRALDSSYFLELRIDQTKLLRWIAALARHHQQSCAAALTQNTPQTP